MWPSISCVGSAQCVVEVGKIFRPKETLLVVAHILGGSKFEYFRAMCIHGIRVMAALVVLSMASAST